MRLTLVGPALSELFLVAAVATACGSSSADAPAPTADVSSPDGGAPGGGSHAFVRCPRAATRIG